MTIAIDPNQPILAESYFTSDMEGWGKQGDCTLTHGAKEGNPGGCLKAVDAATGDVFYYVAPDKFRGDKRSATYLEYDIKWVAAPAVPIFDWDREVELEGGGMLLIYHTGPPPRNQWFHCSVPLSAVTGWTNKTKNRPAAGKDFEVVLASLGKLTIRGEFGHGAETGYLDNVVMFQGLRGDHPV
jgi:hypothetical protein